MGLSDHSGRTTKHFEPLLGHCVCEYCAQLPEFGPFIVGLLKARNELVREGNIYRCLQNMMEFCDTLVVCDDASTDGTDLVIKDFFRDHKIPLSQLLCIPPDEQDFRKELAVKERMLKRIHLLEPKWIWWQDTDEIVPKPKELRQLIQDLETGSGSDRFETISRNMGAVRFPYIQLWREGYWARIDDGFAEGKFVKLWRWRKDLHFDVVERTHHMQFPVNVGTIVDSSMPVMHFGNWGKNLQWKCIQYWGGLGGVERHMDFEQAQYELLDQDWSDYPVMAPGPGFFKHALGSPDPAPPKPFTAAEKTTIKAMKNLKGLPEWFTVVIPTYNRAEFLTETIASLKRQRYGKWIALVLDDGSTDRTPELMRRIALHDPRIFYARHPKRGAVAMNEIGMRFACEATQWWTRLGSDDTFEPDKLLHDAAALKAGAMWCYGPYRVLRAREVGAVNMPTGERIPARQWELAELCNRPQRATRIRDGLLNGEFHVSWANIAASTTLLREIYYRHGNFCPPELINMEDFVVNARMARIALPTFRALIGNGSELLVCQNELLDDKAIADQENIVHEAIWRVNPIGASASTETTGNDERLSREIIVKENARL